MSLPLPSRAPRSGAAAWIEDYYGRLEAVCARAGQRVGACTETRLIAGRTVRFHFIGEDLHAILFPALAHLTVGDAASAADLEVFAWETRLAGEPLPEPPWAWPDDAEPHRVCFPPDIDQFRLMVEPESEAQLLYRTDRRRAYLGVRDARELPTHWYGAPLRRLFHWWGQGENLHLIHAGCIGTEAGGVLLAGRSGSGKSTTSLLGLEAGMRYVGDDSCLLQPGSPAIAHCLYSTGRLHGDHLSRFPRLASRVVEPRPQDLEKPILYAHRHFPAAVANELPLRALVLPRVTGLPDTRAVRISPAEGLLGLAPSTLFQMPSKDADRLRVMARFVRETPCYRLELGTQLEQIAPALGRLIASAS